MDPQPTPDAPAYATPGSDAMFRAMVQSSTNPYVVLGLDGEVTWVSDRVEALLGAPPSAYVGRHFLEMIDPASHPAAIAEYEEFTDPDGGDIPWVGPPVLLELVHADGSRITCEVAAATGRPYGIEGIVVQVRRWRGTVLLYAAVDALAAGESLGQVLPALAAIAEHDMPGSAVFVAAGWDGACFALVEAAPQSAAVLPEIRDDLATAPPPPEAGEGDAALATLARRHGYATAWTLPVTVRGDDHPTGALVLFRHRPGPPGPNHTTASRVSRLLALAIESDRNRRAWRRSATTDQLTGLANRAGLEEWLSEHCLASPNEPLAVLFCDVDGFKVVNDELGHAAGDRILRAVAERLRRSVRPDDLVCRWGGDEFVVVCRDPTAAESLAERLISQLADPVSVGDDHTTIGLSVGIGYGTFASPLDDLLRASDHALLDAKSNGRNRYVVGS